MAVLEFALQKINSDVKPACIRGVIVIRMEVVECYEFNAPTSVPEQDRVKVSILQKPFEEVIYNRMLRLSYENQRNYCRVSYSAIQDTTSLRSKNAVITGIQGLIEKRHIIKLMNEQGKLEMNREGTLYRVLSPEEALRGVLDDGTVVSEINRDGMHFVVKEKKIHVQAAISQDITALEIRDQVCVPEKTAQVMAAPGKHHSMKRAGVAAIVVFVAAVCALPVLSRYGLLHFAQRGPERVRARVEARPIPDDPEKNRLGHTHEKSRIRVDKHLKHAGSAMKTHETKAASVAAINEPASATILTGQSADQAQIHDSDKADAVQTSQYVPPEIKTINQSAGSKNTVKIQGKSSFNRPVSSKNALKKGNRNSAGKQTPGGKIDKTRAENQKKHDVKPIINKPPSAAGSGSFPEPPEAKPLTIME